jgi:hypothetical protein
MAAKKKKKKVAAPKKKTVAKKKVAPKPKKKSVAKKKAAPKKKKVAAKAKAKKAAPKKAKKKPVRRFDRPGHLDPTYAKQLKQQSGATNKDSTRPAFKVEDDDVAEDLGEEVVGKATSGEDEGEEVANAEYTEEVGGPFVVTSGGEEFAEGTDESNPEDAEQEPFPKT